MEFGSALAPPPPSLRSGRGKGPMRSFDPLPQNNGHTFYDDATSIGNNLDDNLHSDGSRDSHDLSLRFPGNRNSVVDHMLLSLDAMPNGSSSFPVPAPVLFTHYTEEENAAMSRNPSPGRRRGHTHTVSRSSDYDLEAHDIYTPFAGVHPRKRSEDIPYLPPSQRNSGRYDSAGVDVVRDGNRYAHTRNWGRKASKSSMASTIDVDQEQSLPVGKSLGSRAASFDHLNRRIQHQHVASQDSMVGRGRPIPGDYWHHAVAAPEPHVPHGPTGRPSQPPTPSRMHPPLPAYELPESARPKRKSSIRSATSRLSRKSRPETADRNSQVQDVLTDSASGPMDPLAAPSPAAGYRKSNQLLNAPIANQNATKERPGFFRRVFGSSKNATAAPQPQPENQRPPTGTRSQRSEAPSHPSDSNSERERPSTQSRPNTQSRPQTGPRPSLQSQHIAMQMKAQTKAPPPPEVPPMPVEHQKEHQNQTLNKKPSSFFRRRKKSVSESKPPVTILQQHPKLSNLQVGADVMPAQQSPSMSSLRKVMNPYLTNSNPDLQNANQHYYNSQESQPPTPNTNIDPSFKYVQAEPPGSEEDHVKGFSPGYAPHKDATIRAVPPGSPLVNEPQATAWGEPSGNSNNEGQVDSPKFRVKLRKNRPATAKTPEDSFLADSSGNEERNSGNLSPLTPIFGLPLGHDEKQRPKTSPTVPSFTSEAAGKENVAPPLPPTAGTLRKMASENVMPGRMLSPITDYSSQISDSAQKRESTEDEWLVRTRKSEPRLKTQMSKASRVWIEDDSDEATKPSSAAVSPLTLPLEGIRRTTSKGSDISPLEAVSPASTTDVFQSATSLPIVQVDGGNVPEIEADARHKRNESHDTAVSLSDPVTKMTAAESIAIGSGHPEPQDLERAIKIFAGDESFVHKTRAAAWLGETSFVSARTRRAYMELFDWTGLSILNAFRELCTRLIIRAESQQLDRIIDAFSQRWCTCNSSHGFKATDVVHTITYSLLMLNTDLHLADIDQKMSRNEFIRNTVPTIRRIADLAADAIPDSATSSKTPQLPLQLPNPLGDSQPSSPTLPPDEPPPLHHASTEPLSRPSTEAKRSHNRRSLLPPGLDLATSIDTSSDNCTVLVNKTHDGSMKAWETQVEIVLREFYSSIRQTPLPLHGAVDMQRNQFTSTHNLTVSAGNTIRRSPSVLSKAPSESASYRGRASEMRSATSRWPLGNKARSRPRIYPTSTIGSSRTSLEDQSVWSPAGSSTWSKYSLGKAHTQNSSFNVSGLGSMSVESFGSFGGEGGSYSQSIGFANALSQAIIREEHAALGSDASLEMLEEFGRVRPLLEDETLELAGAPWAKEGLVKWKHHLATIDKKAKERNWREVFAVVEKGYLRLFSFQQNAKSLRNKKSKQQAQLKAGGAVGGGNWNANAETMGCFLLRQTIASNLPPPGYSKQRPHVWALSLPNGAVHLFQVGTEDIGQEFVKTANYWSARLSKEPLVGGVSNIEYGWGEGIINMALVGREHSRPGSVRESASGSAVQPPRPSLQNSLHGSVRSGSVDAHTAPQAPSSVRSRLPGDKVTISEWSPPVQSMMASQLMEVDQLKALAAYVRAVEEDLDRHNGLRQAMGLAFSPRHPNGQKALANWERKSAYLLREIVKFKTYVGSLTEAQAMKERIYREREGKSVFEAGKVPVEEKEVVQAREDGQYGEPLAPESADVLRRAENAEEFAAEY